MFSWYLLNRISSSHSNPSYGLLVGGNFNKIMYNHEKKGGRARDPTLMNNFRDALQANSLYNLPSLGPKFTWTNNQITPNLILERLDRFVANQIWIDKFPHYRATNLDIHHSDHRHVAISMDYTESGTKNGYRQSFSFNH